MRMTVSRCSGIAFAAALGLCVAASASAHHSYAMFDAARTATVTGTVAKLEWTNPHVFIWVYVPNAARDSGFDLYAFENGSPNVLLRRGWSKETLAVGEKVSIAYWPLADGRTGGHFAVATRVDGSVIRGAGGPGGGVDASNAVEAPAAPAAAKP
jgi:Family of unknown function (DUF6152)